VPVFIDGAQAVGAIPVSVADLGVDYYAVPGQKWLLGPEGTGALWISPDVIERALPSVASWFTFERITSPADAILWGNARRFDDTNFYKPGVVGLARSCGWLSMYVGLPWIHERGQAMAARAVDRLARIRGVELLTPTDRMATLVTFRIAGWEALEALDELAGRTFAVARTIPQLDAIRLMEALGITSRELDIRPAAERKIHELHVRNTIHDVSKSEVLESGIRNSVDKTNETRSGRRNEHRRRAVTATRGQSSDRCAQQKVTVKNHY